ncbi:hypothetical protein [Halorussus sp. AFM4]|uniref:hypothetical protein n=1 Tax=Halorussus sp. AFM4 TaxID=3421651 RepID=UPI003EB742D6
MVAGLLLALLLLVFQLLELLDLLRLRVTTPLYYLFSTLVGGNLTLITVVLSINQLVLSRELESPGPLREEVENVADYRRTVAETAGRSVTPLEPPKFLRLLVQATRQRAQRLGGLTAHAGDPQLRDEVDHLVTHVTENTERVNRLLERSEVKPFEVLFAALTTDYERPLHRARRIRATRETELSPDVVECVDDLIEALEQIYVTRNYFKTMFFQKELAYLSRVLLYVGLPSEALLAVGFLVFASTTGTALPTTVPPAAIPVAVTVGFAPLAVLFAFVVRIAIVAQRTAEIIPFRAPQNVP